MGQERWLAFTRQQEDLPKPAEARRGMADRMAATAANFMVMVECVVVERVAGV